jgi:hypothetical protein
VQIALMRTWPKWRRLDTPDGAAMVAEKSLAC